MVEYIFIILLSLSEGKVELTAKASSPEQCEAIRKEAVKMLGGTKVSDDELEKVVSKCKRVK